MIAEAKSVCILWAMGVTQHSNGSDTSTAISNLLLVTGNYMRPGTGAYPLTRAQQRPGRQRSRRDAEHACRVTNRWTIPRFARASRAGWGVEPACHQGSGQSRNGRRHSCRASCESMYLCGEEMSIVDSNANYVGEAFRKLDFFVVQDIFFSATCQFADVVLPASPSLEKEGTFTSTERRVQRLYQVFEPLRGSRPDWMIIQDVANRLGAGWNYRHPSEVMDEVAALTPMFAGVNYQRLEGYKTLQWPVAADGSDQPLLYTKSFAFPDGKARLFPLAWREPQERTRLRVRPSFE